MYAAVYMARITPRKIHCHYHVMNTPFGFFDVVAIISRKNCKYRDMFSPKRLFTFKSHLHYILFSVYAFCKFSNMTRNIVILKSDWLFRQIYVLKNVTAAAEATFSIQTSLAGKDFAQLDSISGLLRIKFPAIF